MIQCSTLGGRGLAQAHWFREADLAGDRRLLPAFNADGTPVEAKWPDAFEYRPVHYHRANIIERGTPLLRPGWQDRAELVREAIIAECVASCSPVVS